MVVGLAGELVEGVEEAGLVLQMDSDQPQPDLEDQTVEHHLFMFEVEVPHRFVQKIALALSSFIFQQKY